MALLATTAVSAVGSAMGQISQGMSNKTAASNQAIQEDQAAHIAMQSHMEEVSKSDYVANQTLGKIYSNAGAAGVVPGQGSPALVANRSAEEQKISDMYERYSGRLQAVSDLYQGKVDRWSGNRAMISGFIGAGGSLVSGLTKGLSIAHSFGSGGGAPGGGDLLGG